MDMNETKNEYGILPILINNRRSDVNGTDWAPFALIFMLMSPTIKNSPKILSTPPTLGRIANDFHIASSLEDILRSNVSIYVLVH